MPGTQNFQNHGSAGTCPKKHKNRPAVWLHPTPSGGCGGFQLCFSFLCLFVSALTYYYIQPHLVGVVDFSRAFLSSGIGIVMKNRPKAENSLRDFILNSFTFDGWMLILGKCRLSYLRKGQISSLSSLFILVFSVCFMLFVLVLKLCWCGEGCNFHHVRWLEIFKH